MHHKNIKIIVRKQLEKQYPIWSRLNRKTKKKIVRKVFAETVSDYNFSGDVVTKPEEPHGIEQQIPTKGGSQRVGLFD